MSEASPPIDPTDPEGALTPVIPPNNVRLVDPLPDGDLTPGEDPLEPVTKASSDPGAPVTEPTDPAAPELPVAPDLSGVPANPVEGENSADPTNAVGPENPIGVDVSVVSPWNVPFAPDERVAFSFNLAKVSGAGEDSDPILLHADNLALVAVFDGMGGAGGTAYQTPDGPRTGAYLASRAARDSAQSLIVDLGPEQQALNGPRLAAELHDTIEAALRARLASLQAPRSALRSKLLRAMPTTMAMAVLHRTDTAGEIWHCRLLSAGDSRVYALCPDSGVSQLTTDDIRDQGDAMANLRQDSLISNALSADTSFVVNDKTVQLEAPFLLIAATDGCFGYLPSPMHFEWLLLHTLQESPDPDSWSRELQTRISEITGDDASMALLGVGVDHQEFKAMFAERAAELAQRWITPLDALTAEVEQLERQLAELRHVQAQQTVDLWAAYRPDYERYLSSQSQGKDTS